MRINKEITNKETFLLTTVLIMTLSIASWNMRSPNLAGPYINFLSNDNDIIIASEHRLYEHELHKLQSLFPGYIVHAKASEDLQQERSGFHPGHCGICMAYRQSISENVRVLQTDSDRICAIQISNTHGSDTKIFIIGVYLPQRQSIISDFEHHMVVLENLVNTYTKTGNVLIIGDFNSHFGEEFGNRFWGKTSKHAEQIAKMNERQGLTIVDGSSKICTGPEYTFYVDGIGCSYIDHCIISTSLLEYVENCKVINDSVINTSDHLAISVTICIKSLPERHMCKTSHKIAWNKLENDEIYMLYTKPLSAKLEKLNTQTNINRSKLDKILEHLNDTILKSSDNLKSSRFSSGLKPYWNEVLDEINRKKKIAYREWCQEKKPTNGKVYEHYKETKKAFRREMRKARLQYEKDEMMSINQAHTIDHKFFWHLVKKGKKYSKGIVPIQEGHKTITDPTEIREKWKRYFQTLYSTKQIYNQEFQQQIEDTFEDIWQESSSAKSSIMTNPICEDEVVKCVQQLKNNKAPGKDLITAEHIKYGGKRLIKSLAYIFNQIVKLDYYPPSFKVGIIVPIPKGEKDATIMGNNRGITLLSVISKIFDNITYNRHLQWSKVHTPLDSLQGAGQEKCSSIHTTLLLRESISHNIERGSTVYVALLDTAKAFDTVWTKGLFVKMYNLGMDPVIWRLLVQSYTNFQCHVKIGNELSESFVAEQGLHQGAHWSMHMFARHYDDMLKQLRGNGVHVQHMYTGNPTYADDVSIATLYKPLLQAKLDCVYRYSQKWQFEFNASKSVFLIFGTDSYPSKALNIGGSMIETKAGDMHMGILLSANKMNAKDFITQRIYKAKRAFYAAQSIGSRSFPMSPVVMSKLYWSNCMSTMAYGLEVFPLTTPAMQMLEQAHSSMAKQIQGQSQQTANLTAPATLGWHSVETYLDYTKLMFLWRLLLLPMCNVYKAVTMIRLCYHMYNTAPSYVHNGPLNDILNVYRKYSLDANLDECLKTGTIIPIREFKSLARKRIADYEIECFKITCLLYRSLDLYRNCISKIEMWPWWIFAHHNPEYTYKVRVLYRMIVSQSCLRSDIYMFENTSSICILCDSMCDETPQHMLFECSRFEVERGEVWFNTLQKLPPALAYGIDNMNSKQKTEFICKGFNCRYIPEWDMIYKFIIDYVYYLYNKRKNV